MIQGTKVVDGWTIPETDVRGFGWIREDLELVPRVLRHVRDFSACIQAGGNVGLYPDRLAKEFIKVITFEPQPLLFDCLCLNLQKHHNIFEMPFALSNSADQTVPLKMADFGNMGTWFLYPGKCQSSTNAKTMTIDQLALKRLGLIWLDVEGHEIPALMGAMKTIQQHRPVLALEIKDMGDQFGFNKANAIEWVRNQGYQLAEQVKDDFVFTPCHLPG
jgi:FkbM family methyltransferase